MGEKGDKKRKRHDDSASSHKSKKVAVAAPDQDAIKVTFRNQATASPVLAYAPGLSTSATSFKAYAKPRAPEHRDEPPNPKSHSLILHSSEHPRLDYTAVPPVKDEKLSHYIGVYDPETNQLELHPAHHLNLRGVLRSEEKSGEGADGESKGTPYGKARQQRIELGREFGGIRAKRALAAAEGNAIKKSDVSKAGNNVEQAILESVGSAADEMEEKKAEEAKALIATKPIPKPDLDADAVDEIYTFDNLVPPATARFLKVKEWQDKARAGDKMELTYRYAANRVDAVGKSEDTNRLVALRYLYCLLEFHDALKRVGRAGKKVPKRDVLATKLPDWSAPLIDMVTKRFSSPSFELGKWHLDNLYTHMCALSLLVDGWATEISDLRLDLKMENKEISQYYRELGCEVRRLTQKEQGRFGLKKAEASATRMAVLKLPLEFPKVSMGRRA